MNANLYIVIFWVFCSNLAYSQQTPYNEEFGFRVITNNDELPLIDSVQALIVNFESEEILALSTTLRNNLQIRELKLFNPTQAAIDLVSDVLGDSLTYLFIEGYKESVVKIPRFPSVSLLSIDSDNLESLDMTGANLDKVHILDIGASKLIDLRTQDHFQELGLLNIGAPLLQTFPFKSAPGIYQFTFYCSFKEIPEFLCSYEELQFISFTNLGEVELDDCFRDLIYNAFHSSLTILDPISEEVIFELHSKDQR